jgi:bacteriochlorophyll 4-vinyl reductase
MLPSKTPLSPIPPSGYYYANNIARIYLKSIRELIGAAAYADLLQDIGLSRYLNVLPPDDFEQQFDFSDFSNLTAGLDRLEALDPHDPPVTIEAGRACFKYSLKTFGGLAGFSQVLMGFQVFPLNIKIKLGLQAMAITFKTFSDQLVEVTETPDSYQYRILRCPVCWGRHSDKPVCSMAYGLLEAGLYWVTNRHYHITETECCAMGAASCTLVIDKTPLPE